MEFFCLSGSLVLILRQRTQQGCYFSGLTKLQKFSKISPGFPSNFLVFFITLKICNLKELHLNKNLSFLQYPWVKPPLLAYFSNLKGAALFHLIDRKQKIWGLPFSGFISFSRYFSIKNRKIWGFSRYPMGTVVFQFFQVEWELWLRLNVISFIQDTE